MAITPPPSSCRRGEARPPSSTGPAFRDRCLFFPARLIGRTGNIWETAEARTGQNLTLPPVSLRHPCDSCGQYATVGEALGAASEVDLASATCCGPERMLSWTMRHRRQVYITELAGSTPAERRFRDVGVRTPSLISPLPFGVAGFFGARLARFALGGADPCARSGQYSPAIAPD